MSSPLFRYCQGLQAEQKKVKEMEENRIGALVDQKLESSLTKVEQLEEKMRMMETERNLEKELAEQKEKLHSEEQRQLETVKKDQDSALQKYAIQSSQEVKREFLKVLRIVHDTGDSFRFIQSYCSNKMTDTTEHNVTSHVDQIVAFKLDLKNESYRLQQYMLYEKVIDKNLHNVCKDYLQKFENIMDRETFIDLYTQLPFALKSKNESEIRMFGKLAGNFSDDLKRNREEFANQLNRISEESLQN